jgi:UDP-N-acetylmuramoyl-tripeptide--D-alanyl-D-alanine ligase
MTQGGTAIVVKDTTRALGAIGALARDRLPDRVIGVTGSVGKTSVKDLTAAAMHSSFVSAASEKSFNNELGVPLTLANASEFADAAIIEMGARGIGHIRRLCEIARPTIGVVTSVGYVHTELFGTIDDVAQGKGELVEALPPSGTAILNADDERVAAMAARTDASVVTYGITGAPDILATDVALDDDLRPSFVVRSPWGSAKVSLGVRGMHQVPNALAAVAAAAVAGTSLDDAVAGIADAELSPWRMELHRTKTGALVLNDAYNANPISMAAALRSLAALDARRRVAVVGTMAELGTVAADEHRAITELAASLGVRLIAVDEPLYGGEQVHEISGALAALGDLGAGDAVLVKGSRVAGLERLAAALLDGT